MMGNVLEYGAVVAVALSIPFSFGDIPQLVAARIEFVSPHDQRLSVRTIPAGQFYAIRGDECILTRGMR